MADRGQGVGKASMLTDMIGLAKSENERLLDRLFAEQDEKLAKLAGLGRTAVLAQNEAKLEAQEQAEFRQFIEKKLEEEYTESLKQGRNNFTYLHEKNKQGILLYPPMKASIRPWSSEKGFDIERAPMKGGRYMLSHAMDPETEARRNMIQESFLREGEVKREFFLGPFKTPLVFLGISAAFFYKFWSNVK